MGVCVAATADMAPPPAAAPSVLVMTMAPKSAASLKARAWDSADGSVEHHDCLVGGNGGLDLHHLVE
jgi:hypothetical protein